MGNKELKKLGERQNNLQRNYTNVFCWLFVLSIITFFCLVVSIILLVQSGVVRADCHDEYETEVIVIELRDMLEYSYDTEITCEEESLIREYESSDKKVIYSCLELIDGECNGVGKTCIVKTRKEVCEIR